MDAIDRLQKDVRKVLGNSDRQAALVRQIVRRFDVDFDLPLKHDQCLGLLMLLGATRRPDADELSRMKPTQRLEKLAGFVGAGTCRIVRADLAYEYVEGLQIIEDMREEAERLTSELEKANDALLSQEIPRYAAYAAARWLDAAAKLNYRLADHSTARKMFARSLELLTKAGIWSARPDLESNLLRVRFEEMRTTTANENEVPKADKQLIEYEAMLVEVRKDLGARIPDASAWKGDMRSLPFEAREALRGLSSFLHNTALAREAAYKKAKLEAADEKKAELLKGALEASRESQRICSGLLDAYRLSQARQHEGRMLLTHQGKVREAKEIFTKEAKGEWLRGHSIANQWLATVAMEEGDADQALGLLEGIMATFGETHGADIGADIASQSFTIKTFEDALGHKAMPAEKRTKHEPTARLNRLRIVRALRRVVKVSKYKRDYGEQVLPTYLREIARRLQDARALQGPEPAETTGGHDAAKLRNALEASTFLLAEEVSARELLDAMAATSADERDWLAREKDLLREVAKHVSGAAVTPEAGDGAAVNAPAPSMEESPSNADPAASTKTVAESPVSGGEAPARRSPSRTTKLTEKEVEVIRSRHEDFEKGALDRMLSTVQVDPEIIHTVRMFMAQKGQEDQVLVRFLPAETKKLKEPNGDRIESTTVQAFVFSKAGDFITKKPICLNRVFDLARKVAGTKDDGAEKAKAPTSDRREVSRQESGAPPRGALYDLARALHTDVMGPILDSLKEEGVTLGEASRLVIVPTGKLLTMPLHVAIDDANLPLAAKTQVCFSVSATAHVQRGRHRLGTFPVEHDDDLFAFMRVGGGATGKEVLNLGWEPERFQISGDFPQGLRSGKDFTPIHQGEDALVRLADVKPEFFLYSGHGLFDPTQKDLGPVLDFGVEPGKDGKPDAQRFFTQVDIAQHVRLPRNKLTILAACVTGLGMDQDGGEVGGFLRALMAAGSGAIGLTLWNVLDDEAVQTVGQLLRAATPGKDPGKRNFEALRCLREHYARRCADLEDPEARIEACPLALYL